MSIKGAKGKTGRLMAWVVVGLLIVGLAGFGATNFGGSTRSIGSVGDTEISVDIYANALQQELRALQQQTGQNITLQQAQSFGVQQAVLARVISQAALDEETARLGVSIGDERVLDEIVAIPAFQGLDGTFDREAYETALNRANLSVAEFEAQIRGEIARGFVQQAVTGGVAAPETYVDTLYAFARETRDFAWITLTPEDLEEPVAEPSLEELRAYYEENTDVFTTPETRVVTYAWITPEMMLQQLEIPEEELRAAYEQRQEQYVRPERRIVDRLVFSSPQAAQEAAHAIAAGETDFETLLEERDLALSDVELGEVSREELDGEVAEAVFTLEEPGIAGPVESPLGPALYRVNAILSAQETAFEEAREELRSELAADRAQRAIDEMRGDLTDRLAGGATLEDLAEETALELGTVGLRPGAEAPVLDYQAFREAATAAQVGDFPELMELDGGGLFALRLDAVEPPMVQDFTEVRDQVAEAWRAERTQERLMERAEEIATEVEGGATLSELGFDPNTAEGALRSGVVEGVPEEAIAALFEMAPGAARAVPGDGTALVLSLRAINAPDGQSAEAQELKANFAQQTAQSISTDLLSAFTRAVQSEVGISLNQNVISAVHGQFPG